MTTDEHLSQVIQGLGRADTDQGHGQRQPFGFLEFRSSAQYSSARASSAKRCSLVSGMPSSGLARGVQGLQPPDMGQMFADAFGRGLFGFAFEPLPRTGGLVVITAEQARDGLALQVIQRVRDLLVIAVVDLGSGFLRGPSVAC